MSEVVYIAADGGAKSLKDIGIVPDFIVGDMDSYQEIEDKEYFKNSEIIEIREQNSNDFEKCIRFAKEKNYKNILIVGFHGGLLEHTLNNWSVFKKFSKLLNLCIYDKNRFAINVSESISLELKLNEIVSIVPQCSCIITTSGLKWELNHEKLELGSREGARNKATQTNIEINMLIGNYTLFFDERLPYCPVFEDD